MRILMLVATSVATDSRVLREAAALVAAGHDVHVIGKDVPPDFVPAGGFTVSSAGASSVFRPDGAPSASTRRLSAPARAARWALLPQHRNQAFRSWAASAVEDARGRDTDVLHAHDFTALEAVAGLAQERGVPYVYDTHELWSGRSREYRPTPWQDRRELRVERDLGSRAAAVITVGDGIADRLHDLFGWDHVSVVRNTFPLPPADDAGSVTPPRGIAYAGRIGGHRDLETVAAAAPRMPLPVTLVGPADGSWLRENADALASVAVLPAMGVDDVTGFLQGQGVSLVPMVGGFDNHLLAQPNKLFHAVHAGVPVVAVDLPELRRVLETYGFGTLYRAGDPDDLARAVAEVVADHPRFAAAAVAARAHLSWEADAAVLVGIYARLAA